MMRAPSTKFEGGHPYHHPFNLTIFSQFEFFAARTCCTVPVFSISSVLLLVHFIRCESVRTDLLLYCKSAETSVVAFGAPLPSSLFVLILIFRLQARTVFFLDHMFCYYR
ncbi:unnamed protein product [Calicophoron daubneyi]|uniref:Transmembrane protein n=1 Tax=Calicophoron daubneyi TaxID=300641 RepID=A0AAV2T681_CALDB